MEKQGVEPEVVRMIMALAKTLAFTDTLFVSAAGDNSDGSSWDRAYTSLLTALNWIEANQAAGEVHCIMLQAGAWDLNLTGVPTFAANIAIYGVDSRNQATISNGHATATGVLQFTGWCSLNNLTIDCGTGETGININGAGAEGGRLRKLIIITENLTGAADGILVDGGIAYVKITDVVIVGEATNTTGIRFNNATRITLKEIKIYTALVGIHLDNAADDENIFEDLDIHSCITGILIDAGATDNHFVHVHFNLNTTRINDGGTATEFAEMFLGIQAQIVAPDDVAGVLVVGGVGNNVWSAAAVQIRAVSATPFKIVGIAYECAAAEKTGIRLFSDGGTVPIYQTLVETGAAVAGRADITPIDPIWVNQGLAIHARVKSEAGGNNVLIWVLIKIV